MRSRAGLPKRPRIRSSATVLTTGPHDLDRRMMVDALCCLRGAQEDGIILPTELRECTTVGCFLGDLCGWEERQLSRFS
jgi:hypothetical protein